MTLFRNGAASLCFIRCLPELAAHAAETPTVVSSGGLSGRGLRVELNRTASEEERIAQHAGGACSLSATCCRKPADPSHAQSGTKTSAVFCPNHNSHQLE